MKVLGSEVKEFYEHHFPASHYHDDYDEKILDAEGDFTFADTDKVDLDRLGYIVPKSQGSTKALTFASHFAKWKKSKETFSIVVTGPVKLYDEAIAKIKALGFSVKL